MTTRTCAICGEQFEPRHRHHRICEEWDCLTQIRQGVRAGFVKGLTDKQVAESKRDLKKVFLIKDPEPEEGFPYKCRFCDRVYTTAQWCRKHESVCLIQKAKEKRA